MGILDRIFGKKPKARKADDAPPMYGGDGSSAIEATVVNCASMSLANHLIDQFISERHGDKGADWDRDVEYFVNKPDIPEFTVRAINVTTADGEKPTYFFNLSRPMNVAKKLAGDF